MNLFAPSQLDLLIYFLLWVFVFIKQRKHTNGFGPSMFLISSFLVYSLLSFVLYLDKTTYFYQYKITLFPLIYLFFMIMAFLSPSIRYERANIKYIQKPSDRIIYAFLLVYGICTIVILPNAIVNLQKGLSILFLSEYGGADLYQAALEQYEGDMSGSVSGIFGLCSIFHNFFRDISIFVVFYLFTIDKKKWIGYGLVVLMVVDLVLPLAKGNRSHFVTILMTMLVSYFLFKDFWDEKTRKIAKKVGIIVLVLAAIPFMITTISRFGSNTASGGASGGMLRYAGQSTLNFGQYAFDANGTRHGDHVTHEFKRLLGYDVPPTQYDIRYKYSNMNMDDSVFYTFVGDFALDFGPTVSAIIFFILFCFFKYSIKIRDNTIRFQDLLLLYFTLCVCAQGGMYQFTFSLMGNWVIIAFVLMYIVLSYDYKTTKYQRQYIIRSDIK